jgi:hypothetical protein
MRSLPEEQKTALLPTFFGNAANTIFKPLSELPYQGTVAWYGGQFFGCMPLGSNSAVLE